MKSQYLIQVGKGKNWITVGLSPTMEEAQAARKGILESPAWIAPVSTIDRLTRVRILCPNGKIA